MKSSMILQKRMERICQQARSLWLYQKEEETEKICDKDVKISKDGTGTKTRIATTYSSATMQRVEQLYRQVWSQLSFIDDDFDDNVDVRRSGCGTDSENEDHDVAGPNLRPHDKSSIERDVALEEQQQIMQQQQEEEVQEEEKQQNLVKRGKAAASITATADTTKSSLTNARHSVSIKKRRRTTDTICHESDDDVASKNKSRSTCVTTATTGIVKQSLIIRNAGERLAMLLIQQQQYHHQQQDGLIEQQHQRQIQSTDNNSTRMTGIMEADEILQQLGYTCRLSQNILNYPIAPITAATTSNDILFNPSLSIPSTSLSSLKSSSTSLSSSAFYFSDNFVTPYEYKVLQGVFGCPKSSYWVEHHYTVEPPSPYFSYLIPLPISKENNHSSGCSSNNNSNGNNYNSFFMRQLAKRIQMHLIQHWKEKSILLQQATYCEMWSHNRPHGTGHQLHYDTDNEGFDNVVHNPIVTIILYLTSIGGPTLITNQRLSSSSPANTKGWLIYPQSNRLVAMDGKLLHAVIPGKGLPPTSSPTSSTMNSVPNRRVSIMLAYWRRIRARSGPHPGPARPWPVQVSMATTATTVSLSPSSILDTKHAHVAPHSMNTIHTTSNTSASSIPLTNNSKESVEVDSSSSLSSWYQILTTGCVPDGSTKSRTNSNTLTQSGNCESSRNDKNKPTVLIRNNSHTINATDTTQITIPATTNPSTIPPIDVLYVDHIYERTLDGKPWQRSDGFPNYDQVFQGI